MKKAQRLEIENEQLRLEAKQLREQLARKDKEIERLIFGKHVIKGYIDRLDIETDIIEDTLMGEYKSYSKGLSSYYLTIRGNNNDMPKDLLQSLYPHKGMNAIKKLKFTVELDNE